MDAQQQGGGSVPVGDVGQAAADRAPGRPSHRSRCAPEVLFGQPALQGRCLRGEVLTGGSQTEQVEAGERGEIGCGEGTLDHVEVIRDGYCLATSILGGLDVHLRMRRARTRVGWGQGTATRSTAKSP